MRASPTSTVRLIQAQINRQLIRCCFVQAGQSQQ